MVLRISLRLIDRKEIKELHCYHENTNLRGILYVFGTKLIARKAYVKLGDKVPAVPFHVWGDCKSVCSCMEKE